MKNISPTSFAHSVHFKIPTVCTAGLFHNAHTRRKCSHHLGVIQFLHIRVNDHTVLFWFIKNYHHVNRSETEVSMSSQRDCKLDWARSLARLKAEEEKVISLLLTGMHLRTSLGLKVSKSHWSGKFKLCWGGSRWSGTHIAGAGDNGQKSSRRGIKKTVPAGLELTGPNTFF